MDEIVESLRLRFLKWLLGGVELDKMLVVMTKVKKGTVVLEDEALLVIECTKEFETDDFQQIANLLWSVTAKLGKKTEIMFLPFGMRLEEVRSGRARMLDVTNMEGNRLLLPVQHVSGLEETNDGTVVFMTKHEGGRRHQIVESIETIAEQLRNA